MYLYTYGHVTDKVSSAVSGKLFQGCPFLLAGVVGAAGDREDTGLELAEDLAWALDFYRQKECSFSRGGRVLEAGFFRS